MITKVLFKTTTFPNPSLYRRWEIRKYKIGLLVFLLFVIYLEVKNRNSGNNTRKISPGDLYMTG